MGKIYQKRRQFQIKRKQKRKKKLRKLKEKYLAANSQREKKKIAEKIKRIAPHLQIEEYLGTKI